MDLDIKIHDLDVQISDFTDTVLNKVRSFSGLDYTSSFRCFGLFPIVGLELGLLFLDVVHELLDILDWVEVLGLVLFARGAVHEVVVLAGEILDDPLNFWGDASLRAV